MAYKIKFYGENGFVRYGTKTHKTKADVERSLKKARAMIKERHFTVKAKIIKLSKGGKK